jgi:hypothetical protein
MTTLQRLALVSVLAAASLAASAPDPRQALLGTWRGRSVCTGARAACRDETVVYHVRAGPKADAVIIAMNKVEDGREVEMGTIDFKVDFAGRRLAGTFDNGRAASLWEFGWTATELTGTAVMLPSKTKVRNIALRR